VTRLAGLLLCLFCATAGAQSDFAHVTNVQMPPGIGVRDVAYADVNGDGRADLVVAALKDRERQLRVYLQQEGEIAFRAEPDHLLAPVWKDVVAYAVADCHPDAGSEVVLFTGAGAWAWRLRAPERTAVGKLVEVSFLWQLPDPGRVVAWPPAVRDVDGDGRADLVVPEPGGYRIVLQRGEGFDAAFVSVPDDREANRDLVPRQVADRVAARVDTGAARAAMQRYKLSIGSTGAESLVTGGPLVEVEDAVPAPQFADFDADGDLDLLARTEKWVHVWYQGPPGRFTTRRTFRAPVVADRSRKLDISYSAHVVDINRDGHADCVLLAGDQRSKSARTQVLVYIQEPEAKIPLFGEEGLPSQLLVLDGFAGYPRFEDVDGDGYPDLKVGAVRPDLIDTLRAASGGAVRAEFYVYLNRKGTFSRRPDLTFRAQVEVQGLRRMRTALIARFVDDVTGDGVQDFVLRDEETRLRLYLTRRTREGLSVAPRPLWEIRIDDDSKIRIPPVPGRTEILVLEPEQVLHVRFP
jgi:hypothetical protein